MLRLQRDIRTNDPECARCRVTSPEAPLTNWVNVMSNGVPIFDTPETHAWIMYLLSVGNYRLIEDDAASRNQKLYERGIISYDEFCATLMNG